ncbi:hypothetical protein HRU45_04565 [Candidatus Dependentiae bacterium]|nr:hypothetical protein [Candidatus Dependentiae bacterium]
MQSTYYHITLFVSLVTINLSVIAAEQPQKIEGAINQSTQPKTKPLST